MSAYDNIETEMRHQATKATRISAYLNDTIFRNKYIKIVAKSPSYKAAILLIPTYRAKTRPDTSDRKRIMKTTEMKTLHKIAGKITVWQGKVQEH